MSSELVPTKFYIRLTTREIYRGEPSDRYADMTILRPLNGGPREFYMTGDLSTLFEYREVPYHQDYILERRAEKRAQEIAEEKSEPHPLTYLYEKPVMVSAPWYKRMFGIKWVEADE